MLIRSIAPRVADERRHGVNRTTITLPVEG